MTSVLHLAGYAEHQRSKRSQHKVTKSLLMKGLRSFTKRRTA